MKYCLHCGKQLPDEANFCAGCGTKVGAESTKSSQRTTTFDGEIHKCPHCGEVLKSFASVCPACGVELRGLKGSSSLAELSERMVRADTEDKRIFILRTFPIPNNKEDIFEFFYLAYSNFDIQQYVKNLDKEDISDAWLTKMEQCYQKAKLILKGMELDKIEMDYLKVKYRISQAKEAEDQRKRQIAVSSTTTVTPESSKAKKRGFSTWSPVAKVFWIVLNIYTIGIPAIIYACVKK